MKIKMIIVFLLCVQYNYCQTLEVSYLEKKIISKESLEKLPEFSREEISKAHKYVLTYSNGVSIYKNDIETKNIDNSVIENKENETNNYRISQSSLEKFYYKDLKNNLLMFNIYNYDKSFDGKDTFVNWGWEITDEIQIINNIKCKKAISNSYGTVFTAWYTEDFPINDGPDKFNGLPGLILAVSTPYFEWKVINIKIESANISIKKPIQSSITYTLNDIVNYHQKLSSNSKANTSSSSTQGNSTTTTTTTIIRE